MQWITRRKILPLPLRGHGRKNIYGPIRRKKTFRISYGRIFRKGKFQFRKGPIKFDRVIGPMAHSPSRRLIPPLLDTKIFPPKENGSEYGPRISSQRWPFSFGSWLKRLPSLGANYSNMALKGSIFTTYVTIAMRMPNAYSMIVITRGIMGSSSNSF